MREGLLEELLAKVLQNIQDRDFQTALWSLSYICEKHSHVDSLKILNTMEKITTKEISMPFSDFMRETKQFKRLRHIKKYDKARFEIGKILTSIALDIAVVEKIESGLYSVKR